jgi:hypothetical protein
MWDDLAQLFVDFTNWVLIKIVEFMAFLIEQLLSIIPDTNTLDAQSALNGWPSDVLYFLDLFRFDYALQAFFTAYIARFILRRLPFVG